MNTFYRVATLSVIASFALLACGDSGSDTILETLAVKTAPAGATAEAGTTLTATVVAKAESGARLAGVSLSARVTAAPSTSRPSPPTTQAWPP